ncbi:MAG: polymer-forming cytoskeletal protein, partial [Bacteroidetes bacterium]|nr:polymer-forming cytoskeletal protein [Bacteroidota bacterium]
MAKLKETEIPSINLLGSGTTLKGDLTLKGDFRIDGKLVGKIDCKGKIVVGTSGIIDGEIICQNADLSGKIKAKVKVAQLLTLKETAQFSG